MPDRSSFRRRSTEFCTAVAIVIFTTLSLAASGAAIGSPGRPEVAPNTTVKATENTEENFLNSVSCAGADFCMAAASFGGGVIVQGSLAEQWNGSAWSIQDTPNPGFKGSQGHTADSFGDVSCTSPTSCIAVGSASGAGSSTTLAESWDGSTWSIQTTPTPDGGGGLNGVSCVAATSFCMAVGSTPRYGSPIAESWNGTTWNVLNVPDPDSMGIAYLAKVSCVSESWCIAVGGSSAGTLAELWDGTSWSIQTTLNNSSNEFTDISCSSVSWCMAPILAGSTEGWNGTSWALESVATPPGGTDAALDGIFCAGQTSCTGVGGYMDGSGVGESLVETWTGDAWSVVTTPNPKSKSGGGGLSGVSCAGQSDCVAVGSYRHTAGSAYVGFSEVWDGSTWSVVKTPAVVPVTLSPDYGPPRQKVVISASGFAPDSKVAVLYAGGSSAKENLCSGTAASNGAFSCDSTIPKKSQAGSSGAHTVTASGAGGLKWSTTFTLT